MQDVTDQDVDRAIALMREREGKRVQEREEFEQAPARMRKEWNASPNGFLAGLTQEQLEELDALARKPVDAGEGFASFDATNIPVAGPGYEVDAILRDQKIAARIMSGDATNEERFEFARNRVNERRQRTFWGGVGEMAVDSSTLMAEMGLAAAGGAGAGALAARAGLKAAASEAKRGIGRALLRRTAEVGALTAAREQVPQMLGHGGGAWTAASIKRALPGLEMTEEEAEQMAVLADRDFADRFLGKVYDENPLLRGALEDFTMLGAERAVGSALNRLPLMAKVKSVQARVWQKLTGGLPMGQAIARVADDVAYAGMTQETIEELVADATVEGLFGDGALSGLPSSFRELAQIAAVGAMPAGVAGLATRVAGHLGGFADGSEQAGEEASGTETSSEGGDSVSPEAPTDANQGVADGVTEAAEEVAEELGEAASPAEEMSVEVPDAALDAAPQGETVEAVDPVSGPFEAPTFDSPMEYSGPPGTFEIQSIGRDLWGSLHEVPAITKGKTVTAPDVMNALGNIVGVMGREFVKREGVAGHVRRGARGTFNPRTWTIRLQRANDIAVGAHEVAHAVDFFKYGQTDPWVEGGAADITPEMRAELDTLGHDLYGDNKPNAGYLREGWAEFMRMYITQDGTTKAPRMTDWMEQTFLPQNPEIADAVTKAREHARVWRFQGTANRLQKSMVGIPSRSQRAINAAQQVVSPGFWQNMADKWVERFGPLRRADKIIAEAKGSPLKASEASYMRAKAMRQTAAARLKYMIERGMMDFATNPTGVKPLTEIQKMIGGRGEDFSIFLWAQRAKALWEQPITDSLQEGQTVPDVLARAREANPLLTDDQILERMGARDPGMSYADTKQLLAEYDGANFEPAAELVYQWYDGVMDYVSQSSPTLAAGIKKMREVDPGFYVPLKRVFETLSGRAGRASNAQSGSISKRLKGSGRQVKDPLEQLAIQAAEMIDLAHERFVLEGFIAAGMAHEGLGGLIEEVKRGVAPAGGMTVDQALREVAKRIEGESVQLGEALEQVRDALGDSADEVITLFAGMKDPKQDGAAPILPVVMNGKVRWFQVNKDIYDAIGGVTFKRLPRILDIVFGIPKRAFTAGTTQLMPDFALIANPSRDFAVFQGNSSAGNPARSTAAYFTSMLPALKASTERTASETDTLADFMLRSGIKMTSFHREDSTTTRALARQLKKRHGLNLLDYGGNALRTALDVMNTPELIPRMAEMQVRADQLGYDFTTPMDIDTMIELMVAGGEVTVDFRAAGEYGRLVNQVVPFFNVAIQSPRAMLRAFKRNPAAFVLNGMATATIPALAMWLINRDEEWYQEMPDEMRYTNFYARSGDKLFKVPRAFEFHYFFATVPEILMNAWYQDDPEGAVEFARRAVGDLVKEGNRALVPNTLAPMPVQALYEHAKNEDSFFKTPIIPRSLEDAHPADQYNEFTSRAAKEIGQALNVSPMLVEHYVESFFGSLGRKSLQATGRDINALERAAGWDQAPLIGRLLYTGGPDAVRSRSVNAAYELRKKLNADRIGRSNRNEEDTREHKAERAFVNDVIRGLSAMGRMATLAKTPEERSNLLRRRREFAKDAMVAHRDGAWRSIAKRYDVEARNLDRQRDVAEDDFRRRVAARASN